MSRYTYIPFYLSETGGKFHLPRIGWDADTDHAACRASIMLDTRYGAESVSTNVDMIEKNRHSMFICDNCARIAVNMEAHRARIAVNMAKEDQS